MTSKERMLMAIGHEEPDRVPTGEWQYGASLIEPVLGRSSLFSPGLRRIQAFWDGRRDDVIRAWKQDLVELTQRLGWDAVLVHLVIGKDTPVEKPEQIDNKTWRDSRGNRLQYSPETERMFVVSSGDGPEPDALKADPAPTSSELEVVRHVVRELGRTHLVFSAPLAGHPRVRFSDASGAGVVDEWVRLYEDPDAFLRGRMRQLESERCRVGLETAAREGVHAVAFSWDYGSTMGPFMSPGMFRRAILPYLAALVEKVHSYGLLFFHHACGKNQALMDMIVEAGVDVYQSIQPEMDIVAMKRRYGSRIALWGGVSSGALVTSTPETVKREAVRVMEACKPGGGYVFSTSHSVMPGARIENYMAMRDACREYGGYGSWRNQECG